VIDQISSMGTNLLTVRPGAPNQRGRDTTATLVPDDVRAIGELPNVLAAVPEQSATVTIRYGNADHRTSATATGADFTIARDWPIARGTFFSAADERSYATVAVLGQTVANALFGNADPVGEFVVVNSIMFQIVGVMGPMGATPWGSDQDDVIFVPYSTGSLRLFGQRYLRSATVAVEDVAQIDDTQDAVHALLLARHAASRTSRSATWRRSSKALPRRRHTDRAARHRRRNLAARRRHRRHEHHVVVGHRAHTRDRHSHGDRRRG